MDAEPSRSVVVDRAASLRVIPRRASIELWAWRRGTPTLLVSLTPDAAAELESALAWARAHVSRTARVLESDPGVYGGSDGR